MSISSGSSSSDALNRLTDDSLSTPTKVERSAVPLAQRLPYSYLFSGTLSTGIPFRDHPNPLCAALVPSLGQVWIGTSGGFVCIWTLEAQRQLTRFRASSSSSSIKGIISIGANVWVYAVDGQVTIWKADTWLKLHSFSVFDISATSSSNISNTALPISKSPSGNVRSDIPFSSTCTDDHVLMACSPPHVLHCRKQSDPFQPMEGLVFPTSTFFITSLLYDCITSQLWIGNKSGMIYTISYPGKLPSNLEERCSSFHTDGITSLVRAGDQVWSSSADLRIASWDAITRARLRTIFGHSTPITSLIALGSDVASADTDGTIVLWSQDPASRHPKQPHSRLQLICPNPGFSKYAAHNTAITSLVSSRQKEGDSQAFWAVSMDGVITTWERSETSLSASGSLPAVMYPGGSFQEISTERNRLSMNVRVSSTPGLIEDDTVLRRSSPGLEDSKHSSKRSSKRKSSSRPSKSSSKSSSRRSKSSSKSSSSKSSSKSGSTLVVPDASAIPKSSKGSRKSSSKKTKPSLSSSSGHHADKSTVADPKL